MTGRALVTGGAGFVGACLVRRLLRDGWEVTAPIRPDSRLWRLEEVRADVVLPECDLRAAAAVASVLGAARPDAVFHLAAHGAYSWQRDPGPIMESNLHGTANVVEAAARAGCGVVVNAGSSSEYGPKDHAPAEDEPLEPGSAYGVAKAAAGAYVRQAAADLGVRAVTLRLYSVYGPWEDPRRLMPQLVRHALEGRLPPLADPEAAHDFIWVEDVCEAFILAARASLEPGVAINVGSGRQTTLREAVAAARTAFGVEAEPDWGSLAARDWDTEVWVADRRRAEELLGWRPATSLEDGLAALGAWLQGDQALLAGPYALPSSGR